MGIFEGIYGYRYFRTSNWRQEASRIPPHNGQPLVGARSHWKYLMAHFFTGKVTSKSQAAELAAEAFKMAAKAGRRVQSITTDRAAVNLGIYQELSCCFTTSCDSIVTTSIRGILCLCHP